MNRVVKILFITIIFTILFLSIGYSTFGTKMIFDNINIKVTPLNDIRVTKFIKEKSEGNALLRYCEFTKDTLSFGVNMPKKISKIDFILDITNFGNVEMGVYSITGLPDYLEYQLVDYNIYEPICNNGKCTNNAVKSMHLIIKYKQNVTLPSNKKFNITMRLTFNPFYDILYKNIVNNGYPTKIMKNTNLNVKFSNDIPQALTINMNEKELIENIDYTYNDNLLIINNVIGNVTITKKEIGPEPPQQQDVTITFHDQGGETNKYNYALDITNNTKQQAKGWEIYIKVPKGTTVSSSWSCNYKIEGEYLIISDSGWNGSIAPGQTLGYVAGITFTVPPGSNYKLEYTSKIITGKSNNNW